MFAMRFKPGPGTAIVAGVLCSLFSIWVVGGNPAPGEHKLAVFSIRIGMALIALSLHEWAHGAVAYVLGDTTSRDQGRLTLDPRAHFDPIGLLVVPGILAALGSPAIIGWAKPVPVVFSRLRFKRWGMALVAVAGPGANLFAALFCASLLRILDIHGADSFWGSAAWTFAVTNMLLAMFNMLPLYPMDGGRIVACMMPLPVRIWLANHEGKAAIAALSVLVLIPVLSSLTAIPVLEPMSQVLDAECAFLTGSANASWYGPMQHWIQHR